MVNYKLSLVLQTPSSKDPIFEKIRFLAFLKLQTWLDGVCNPVRNICASYFVTSPKQPIMRLGQLHAGHHLTVCLIARVPARQSKSMVHWLPDF